MVEEEAKKEEAKQEPAMNLIDQAKAIRDDIRAENDRREAILKQEQELHAVQMLSGTTTAGQPIKGPEELEKEKTQKLADEITNAFK